MCRLCEGEDSVLTCAFYFARAPVRAVVQGQGGRRRDFRHRADFASRTSDSQHAVCTNFAWIQIPTRCTPSPLHNAPDMRQVPRAHNNRLAKHHSSWRLLGQKEEHHMSRASSRRFQPPGSDLHHTLGRSDALLQRGDAQKTCLTSFDLSGSSSKHPCTNC